jgi:hypothetical protein
VTQLLRQRVSPRIDRSFVARTGNGMLSAHLWNGWFKELLVSTSDGDPASGSMGMLIYIGEADATDERIA